MEFKKNTDLLPQICEVKFVTSDAYRGAIAGTLPGTSMPIVDGSFWNSFYHSAATLEFTENQELTPHGSIYSYNLQIQHPGKEITLSHNLSQLDHHQWILALIYTDGSIRIIGNEHQACDFKWAQSQSGFGYTMQWSMTDTQVSHFMSYIPQFIIDANQHLIQQYDDGNTYTLNVDGHLIVEGPTAHTHKYLEGHLIPK